MDGRFRIRETSAIGPDISRLVVHAPRVAAHARPGQFVVIRTTDAGERIPLTICDHQARPGTIVLVVQAVGRTTSELCAMSVGDELADVLGPLGTPTEIKVHGHCVVVAGGVGIAIALPVMRALANQGNRLSVIFGARTADHAILLDDAHHVADRVLVTTEDGSLGTPGLVTDALAEVLPADRPAFVFVAGPIGMMKAVAESTRGLGIETVASLNPIMVDGTGMCGGCRVSVDSQMRFACIDGPDFDAHLVDFDMLRRRNEAYRSFEACQITAAAGSHD